MGAAKSFARMMVERNYSAINKRLKAEIKQEQESRSFDLWKKAVNAKYDHQRGKYVAFLKISTKPLDAPIET
jgi:hypothetical protein